MVCELYLNKESCQEILKRSLTLSLAIRWARWAACWEPLASASSCCIHQERGFYHLPENEVLSNSIPGVLFKKFLLFRHELEIFLREQSFGTTSSCQNNWKYFPEIRKKGTGLPWWLSGEESACQCRRHRFNPWSRKIPYVEGQPSPCTATSGPVL